MPKMKTKSGAAKRFKRTANGFKHRRTNRAHILTKKAKKRKRHLRGTNQVTKCEVKTVVKMLADH
ncbi:MAG: 50S ribosomal protein L35 [Legionellales bacterium]|nr:50S ribosomal protein L35 [Legionellales bacterium]|tara:strand:- start:12915 stop:13109 length:195 start_codon:yes stop_codon:yes gene_type:complete